MSASQRRSFAVFVLAFALSSIGAAQSAFPGANGQLAYSGDDGEIHAVLADGTSDRTLTSDLATDQSPAWAPDGARLAFGSFRGEDGRQSIWLMNGDGTDPHRVSPESNGMTDDMTPSWSPNNSELVFASTRPWGDSWSLWAMNDDGTNLRRLTPGFAVDPAWSPDGSRIAYVGADSAVHVMNADGSDARRLTTRGLPEDQPSWSPDGRWLVFARYRTDWETSNSHELFVIRVDGTGERQLTAGEHYDGNPSWSPDGTLIAFQRHQAVFGTRGIYVLPAAGGSPQLVAWGGGEPDWRVNVGAPPPPDDTTPPNIRITSPGHDDDFVAGSYIPALFACFDGDGPNPPPAATCEAEVRWAGGGVSLHSGDPLPTGTVGPHTFFVLARDAAGNEVGETRVYDVVFGFDGFFSPLAPLPALMEFKAGHGVPVKFSLGGDFGLDVLAGPPRSREISCESPDLGPWGVETTGRLSFNASQARYTWLWETDPSLAGTCRQLVVTLADFTEHYANVQFR